MPKKAKLGDTYFDATNGYVMECVRGHAIDFGRAWVAQQIVRMCEKLGRPLLPGEIVRHKDEDKTNNKRRNLVLTSRTAHPTLHRGRKRTEETKELMSAAAKARCTDEWKHEVSERVKKQHSDGKFGRQTWRK